MAFLIGAYLIILLFLVAYIYLKRKANYWKNKGVPCENQLLFFGNFLDIIGNNNVGKYIEQLYNKFNAPYFGFVTLNRPYLVVKDPEIITQIMIKDFQAFPNRFFVCDAKIDPIMSYSLLGIKKPQWKILRTKVSPIFSSGKIKMMLPLITKCAENLSRHVHSITGKNADVQEIAAKYTTDVISTCAFGIEANSFVNDNSQLRVAGRKLTKNSFYRAIQALSYSFAPVLVKLFKFKFFEGEAVRFLSEVFKEAISLRKTTKTIRNDLIDILIDLRERETPDDEFKFDGDKIIAQALMFFVAGHDATSSTISFALHQLCVHPDIQKRLRKEVLEVVQKFGGVTFEAIQAMKYLDQVVSETLRLYLITPFIQRECVVDYQIAKTGLVIEKGTNIIIPQHGLHNDSQYFENPKKFDPDRFNNENRHTIPSCTYIPFGEGPRNCVGERFGLLSTKLGLIYLLKEFFIEHNSETTEELSFCRSDLLRTPKGIRLTFQEIN